jgi:hypothetical protein
MLRIVQTNIQILRNGHLVSRASDYIIYSVEAAGIGRVVAEYGPCMFALLAFVNEIATLSTR